MKYPMDFDDLKKGQVLEIQQLERVLCQDYQLSNDWDMQLMKLQSLIHQHRQDLTVAIDHDRIRVLTDAEASEHNAQLVARGARLVMSRNERLLSVDRGELSADESAAHDRRVLVSSALAAGIDNARRTIVALPARGLPRRSQEVEA
jgi:hypothetical protein